MAFFKAFGFVAVAADAFAAVGVVAALFCKLAIGSRCQAILAVTAGFENAWSDVCTVWVR
jgi:hypothetical protein